MKFENQNDLGNALMFAQKFADENSDGHFTLMRFTTNWRCSFDTPNSREDIDQMSEGKTAQVAVMTAVRKFNNKKFGPFIDRKIAELEKELKNLRRQ